LSFSGRTATSARITRYALIMVQGASSVQRLCAIRLCATVQVSIEAFSSQPFAFCHLPSAFCLPLAPLI
jgi:hypothetical protein